MVEGPESQILHDSVIPSSPERVERCVFSCSPVWGEPSGNGTEVSGLTSLRSDVGIDLVGRPKSQSPVERKAHIPISNPSSNLFDAPANINPPTIPIFPYQPPYPISSSPLPYLRFLKAIMICETKIFRSQNNNRHSSTMHVLYRFVPISPPPRSKTY